jgi:hypothetical protein
MTKESIVKSDCLFGSFGRMSKTADFGCPTVLAETKVCLR